MISGSERECILTQEQIEKIATITAQKVVQSIESEQKKEKKKREKVENKVAKTKEMLREYRRMKAMLAEEREFSKDEEMDIRWKFIQDLMGKASETLSRSEQLIQNSEKRRQENLYCIRRIEKAVEMYGKECEHSESVEAKRRYRELKMMYLSDKVYTMQEIAEIENVSDKTVYKDIGVSCKIVSAYLFGV